MHPASRAALGVVVARVCGPTHPEDPLWGELSSNFGRTCVLGEVLDVYNLYVSILSNKLSRSTIQKMNVQNSFHALKARPRDTLQSRFAAD